MLLTIVEIMGGLNAQYQKIGFPIFISAYMFNCRGYGLHFKAPQYYDGRYRVLISWTNILRSLGCWKNEYEDSKKDKAFNSLNFS